MLRITGQAIFKPLTAVDAIDTLVKYFVKSLRHISSSLD
jgi:hypothetical protein